MASLLLYLPWSLACLLCAWVLVVLSNRIPSIMKQGLCLTKSGRARQKGERIARIFMNEKIP